jgi:signal transduction histidine kinase
LTRVAVALVVAAGSCAAGLAALTDPLGRHRALHTFALAHLVFGVLFLMQWVAILELMLPPVVGWGPLLAGVALMYAATTGSSAAPIRRLLALAGSGDAGAPRGVLVDVKAATMDALRSQYEEHIQQAARQEERTRLARDLHDAVKQQLFVIQTGAATIDARFDGDASGAREALQHVRRAAREALTEMDAMIEQLQAAPVETTGLVESLRRQCEALAYRTGADVELRIGNLPKNNVLQPGTQLGLFRGAQEALANVGRHARAKHVTVSLGVEGRRLELTVEDDGAGFDPITAPKGMGLDNMTARAAVLNGSFMLTSAPGRGTTVRFSVRFSSDSPREYVAKASAWAAVLAAGIWYFTLRGLGEHPWALGIAVIAGVATSRYVLAYARARRSAGGTAAW